MKTLTVKVPEELDAQLASAARQRRQSKSTLVREAIVSYVSGTGSTIAGPSCYEVASDLAGCFTGPVDLGRNKDKHLEGFGQ